MPEKISEHYRSPENEVEAAAHTHEQVLETKIEHENIQEQHKSHRFRKRHSNSDAQSTGPAVNQRSIDPEVLSIEKILAQDLDSFFIHLSPSHQRRFKADGETTALKIQEALRKQTTKVKDIVNLIINWLKGLPGINRFFLEQEAKIKADTIMRRYRS